MPEAAAKNHLRGGAGDEPSQPRLTSAGPVFGVVGARSEKLLDRCSRSEIGLAINALAYIASPKNPIGIKTMDTSRTVHIADPVKLSPWTEMTSGFIGSSA